MDDIRRPHNPERRDYTVPVHREPLPGAPRAAQRPHYPLHHQTPVHHQPASTPIERPLTAPAYHQLQPNHHQTQRHHPSTVHHTKKRNLKPVLIIAMPVVVAAIFAAGYSLKSSNDSNGIPPAIAKQAKFDLFFPSPMPGGYAYMKNTATFQIGKVFYKFSSGNNRVTVKEEPLPQLKPNLGLLSGYSQFSAPLGQVAIGTAFGEPEAIVITHTTVITMNSSGKVSPSDLKTAIDNLKNIGQNPGHQPSNG